MNNNPPITNSDDFLDSFNISLDAERGPASYVELLSTYNSVFERNKQSENMIKEITMELDTLKSNYNELMKEKEEKINTLNADNEKMIDKLKAMEKLLQHEIEQSDEIRKVGERERKELNQKNRELEHEVLMKSHEICETKKLIKEVEENEKLKSSDLEQEMKKKRKELNQAKSEVEIRDNELGATKSKIEEKNNELIEAKNEIEKRGSVIHIIENRLEKNIEKNSLLEEDISQCRGENVKRKNELKQMRRNDEFYTFKTEYNSFKNNVMQEIAELKKMKSKRSTSELNQPLEKMKELVQPNIRGQSQINVTDNSQPITTTLQSSNKFTSLRYQSNEPQSTEASPNENGETRDGIQQQPVLRPGKCSYSGAVMGEKKALVVTTSMARSIDERKFNEEQWYSIDIMVGRL